ncbi:MAG: hypothetical protein WBF39_11685 [Planococcus donghaensis]
MAIQGSGYLGSTALQTSTANQEIVPSKKVGWTSGYKLYKFSFDNENQDCTVRINGETTLFLKAGQGFEIEQGDAPIHSFIIVTAGVTFSWIGAF